ncbi:molybdopterin cofactor-binding domain-containing protein [Muricoccus aerilatus]|uniref:molybdopterin cofactor-binding domain-containing protein n=1 Tax=Muricoccus aerilatus TaxID=452982 RepID=UPI000A014989|nr:molybdopterin cofactor-binding domain-containing protein [Roseomonas aerilata]
MTARRDTSEASREALLSRGGHLAVSRDPAGQGRRPEDPATELFLVMDEHGATNALNGHVDLGTGIRTALAQIVAEELDLPLERVSMLLGNTGAGPDQGGTIASETIQVTAHPLRAAAAQARAALLALAADELGVPVDALRVVDGVVGAEDGNRFLAYAELLRGRRIHLQLDPATPVKPVESYRVVGQPVPRTDIPAKAAGTFSYVHDLRVPGMLHGRVVRPPYAGIDSGDFVGNSLIGVDKSSVADIPGLVAVVTRADFVGVVCEREEHAILAAQRLKVAWREPPALPDLAELEAALRANPAVPRRLKETGDVDASIASAATAMRRTYVWPYHMHASIGPSCAVARMREDGITVWAGTQNPHWLRDDLALLLGLPVGAVEVVRMEAAGCYGRNCADDVAADAALLARAVGRPVRVQLSREQEHAWEPKGPGQLMDVNGALDERGELVAYEFETRFPGNRAPTLALILTGVVSNIPSVGDIGDRTAIPPYDIENMRITVQDTPPIVRASWLRGVAALPNTFAHESYMDEMAAEARIDPVEFRLRYLHDPRAVALVRATAERAGWQPRPEPSPPAVAEDGLLHGRGFAYAVYVHGKFPGTAAAWSAWVVDVAVDPGSGEVSVTRVTAGQDTGLMINPAGVRHQLHGNVIQATSRVLKERVTFEHGVTTSNEWGAYPIITFPEVPRIDALLLQRHDQPALGAGESASVPSAAAIANAIFDATGVRFREPPFTPDRIRAGLRPEEPAFPQALPGPPAPPARKRRFWTGALSGLVGAGGLALAALPWRPAIAPIAPPDPAAYAPATIERGRLLVALGDCAVCHTAENGIPMAGGRALETPFGEIVTPNLTPDPETGIGGWSYTAFERAMRDGIGRDGRHLYPAFPYTNFTRTTDADLQAIYAYLMAQRPVRNELPRTGLAFPYNLRPLLAGWNALFHRPGTVEADPARSADWNRGAYLVEGLGHCGACHTPRNALGAMEGGGAHLTGAMVEGWEAPALTGLSRAPVPWDEAELFAYLRTGQAQFHGVAAGNMAPVVEGLRALPDADIRAMATYLASFMQPPPKVPSAIAASVQAASDAAAGPLTGSIGQRIFDGACAVCHDPRTATGFGARPNLAFNTNLYSDRPDNLLRVMLEGIPRPAVPELGAMPAFAGSLTDAQLIDLTHYLRARFAPGRPAWSEVRGTLARLRDR